MLRHWRKVFDVMLYNFYPIQCLHCKIWLGGFLQPKCLHYGKNISVSFKVAAYSFLKSGKHMIQTQNLVHWYFVRRMKLNIWYRTSFWESKTVTKNSVTVVAMTEWRLKMVVNLRLTSLIRKKRRWPHFVFY